MLHSEITVGSIVILKVENGLGNPGDFGVCYDVNRLGNTPCYGFIFERGTFRTLGPSEVEKFLDVTSNVSRHAACYKFTTVEQLDADYHAEKFETAFYEAYASVGVQLWPEPRADWPQDPEPQHDRDSETDIDR
jgi:hypothetical protein